MSTWAELAQEERSRCRARRARVLAWPDIAKKLTKPPIRYQYPEQWNGFIPPKVIETSTGATENVSIIRAALIDICNEVLEAERAEQGLAPADPGMPPSSPGSISPKQLQRLHIMFGEVGITERAEKLDYCSINTGRTVESTKNLSRNEAAIVMDMLAAIIEQEKQ